MKEIELSLNEKQKEKINEVIEYFNDVYVHTEVCFCLDEDNKETELALQKIEEAKFWAIKSVMKSRW